MYNVHCTPYTVRRTLYNVQCTTYTVRCTLYDVHCTTYTIQRTLYYTLPLPTDHTLPLPTPTVWLPTHTYTERVYSVLCTLYVVQCTTRTMYVCLFTLVSADLCMVSGRSVEGLLTSTHCNRSVLRWGRCVSGGDQLGLSAKPVDNLV